MPTFGELAENISRIAGTVSTLGNTVKRVTAVAILTAVVMGTPVGNTTLWGEQARRRMRPGYVGGRARANWQVSINTAIETTKNEVDPTGSGAINDGTRAADTSQPGEAIYIVNNLPYIVPLNEGHSHQAPVGFIEQAIAAGEAEATRVPYDVLKS